MNIVMAECRGGGLRVCPLLFLFFFFPQVGISISWYGIWSHLGRDFSILTSLLDQNALCYPVMSLVSFPFTSVVIHSVLSQSVAHLVFLIFFYGNLWH